MSPRMMPLRFQTCPVPDALAPAVREMWLLEDDGRFHAGLPKPYVELVVSLAGIHWWRAAPAAREHRFDHGWVTPIQHGPRYARAVGRRRLIGARLEPWAATRLFGPLPAGDGRPPPTLRRLLGAEAGRLRRALVEAPDDAARFARLAGWLAARDELRGGTWPALDPAGPPDRATELARMLRISPRSLRRRFASDHGVAPKTWLKLHRLDAVLRELNASAARRSMADIAAAHGYADQAHLSREVGALTGDTPGVLRTRPEQLPPHLLPRS